MPVALKPLSQQVIVITGASSGIGLVTARMAARQGAKVVAAARNDEALNNLAEEIRAQGGQAIAVHCDVGKEEDVKNLADTAIREFGRIDTWVNNAGISIFGQVWDVPMADWHRMFDTVYWGVVHGSLAALAHYRERGGPGAIINVGSFFGDRAPAVQSTYASAKFAVHGFTEGMRTELEHNGIPVSVSLIHPGRIDTPYNEHAGNFMPMQPVHRGMIYPPEAVAEAILWCAEHPKRDMYVGSQAKAAALIGFLAPHFTDWVMKRLMYTSHQSRTRRSSGPPSRALFQPGYGGHERGTHEPHLLRKHSFYVKATKRPVATAALLTAAALLIGSALRRTDEWDT
ncbi:Short-chain dehydrogenase [Roseomonas rosea]|uniref:Short-chain dehydrogenase n=1 Tax=Muricoccus roseus TaxID=198092 RepID=A0A1M6Q8C4_9PROT|nr:SDR family oxidoreductase [Roseomonas rosea]SHK16534.1 Short-chain dehydrogenase [Roseomonas rosea]